MFACYLWVFLATALFPIAKNQSRLWGADYWDCQCRSNDFILSPPHTHIRHERAQTQTHTFVPSAVVALAAPAFQECASAKKSSKHLEKTSNEFYPFSKSRSFFSAAQILLDLEYFPPPLGDWLTCVCVYCVELLASESEIIPIKFGHLSADWATNSFWAGLTDWLTLQLRSRRLQYVWWWWSLPFSFGRLAKSFGRHFMDILTTWRPDSILISLPCLLLAHPDGYLSPKEIKIQNILYYYCCGYTENDGIPEIVWMNEWNFRIDRTVLVF